MPPVAVLSDIHGNLPALKAVASDLKSRGVRKVLNLGDHLSGPLWPRETLAFLRRTDWTHIRGNHDRCLVERDPLDHGLSDAYAYQFLSDDDLEWLGSLPGWLELDGEITLFHGRPEADDRYFLDSIAGGQIRPAALDEILVRLGSIHTPLVLCGHSHTPRIVELPEGRLAVNPGSVGLQAYLDEEPHPHRVENGSPQARYALLERTKQGWQAQIVQVEYDHLQSAEQARRNGRPEWARALLTGFVQ